MSDRKYDLEDRLLDYSADVIRVVEGLRETKAATHVGGQLIRCGTSPLFNHGEAQAAESPKDFVHKMKLCLKELRESDRALKLIQRVPLTDKTEHLEAVLVETDELIRIFYTSIQTAEDNRLRETPDEEYEA